MDNKIGTRWSPKPFTKPENQQPEEFDENGHQNSSPNSNLCLRDPASCVCLVTANIPPCKSSNSFLFLLFLFSSHLFYYSLRVVAPVSFNNEKKKRIKRGAKKRNEERRWPKELPFILSIDSFIWFIAHYRRVLARYYANKAITESACTYVEPCST